MIERADRPTEESGSLMQAGDGMNTLSIEEFDRLLAEAEAEERGKRISPLVDKNRALAHLDVLVPQEWIAKVAQGRWLTLLKDSCEHGEFLPLVMERYGLEERTARNRMALYRDVREYPRWRDFAEKAPTKFMFLARNLSARLMHMVSDGEHPTLKKDDLLMMSPAQLRLTVEKERAERDREKRSRDRLVKEEVEEGLKERAAELEAYKEENARLLVKLGEGGLPDDQWIADWAAEMSELVVRMHKHTEKLEARIADGTYEAIPCRITVRARISASLTHIGEVTPQIERRIIDALKLRDDGLPDELPPSFGRRKK